MSRPYVLPRKIFSEFLPDQRSITAFESLFSEHALLYATVAETFSLNEDINFTYYNEDADVTDNSRVSLASVSGLTLTMPKCSDNLLGSIWVYTLLVAGNLTINVQGGDTFPSASSDTSTSIIINTRGDTLKFRCIATDRWCFA